jgi:hypothetical protein
VKAAPACTPEQTRDAIRELGLEPKYLCREPWESYYILRRGILPCCYGSTPIAPMDEWATAWNSPALQDIRSHLAQGRLSPYCLKSPGCPIVQRHRAEHPPDEQPDAPAPPRGLARRAAGRILRWLSPGPGHASMF